MNGADITAAVLLTVAAIGVAAAAVEQHDRHPNVVAALIVLLLCSVVSIGSWAGWFG